MPSASTPPPHGAEAELHRLRREVAALRQVIHIMRTAGEPPAHARSPTVQPAPIVPPRSHDHAGQAGSETAHGSDDPRRGGLLDVLAIDKTPEAIVDRKNVKHTGGVSGGGGGF